MANLKGVRLRSTDDTEAFLSDSPVRRAADRVSEADAREKRGIEALPNGGGLYRHELAVPVDIRSEERACGKHAAKNRAGNG